MGENIFTVANMKYSVVIESFRLRTSLLFTDVHSYVEAFRLCFPVCVYLVHVFVFVYMLFC